jgi:hypothetical protein
VRFGSSRDETSYPFPRYVWHNSSEVKAMSVEFTTPSQVDDVIEHEHTFESFVHLIAISTFLVLSLVVALAIGGVEGRWLFGLFWIVAAFGAAMSGLAIKRIGWKLSAAVLGLAVLSLI